MPKKRLVVVDEEYSNNKTMAEGDAGDYEGLCVDEEDELHDYLRYNGEGKIFFINRELIEESFEANNHNIIKDRSESRNTTAQSNTKAKTIDLSWTANMQLLALD